MKKVNFKALLIFAAGMLLLVSGVSWLVARADDLAPAVGAIPGNSLLLLCALWFVWYAWAMGRYGKKAPAGEK